MGTVCSKCLGKDKLYKKKGIEEDPTIPEDLKDPKARRPPVAQNQQEDGGGRILTNEGAEIDPRDVSEVTEGPRDKKKGDRRKPEPKEETEGRKKDGRSNGRGRQRRHSTDDSSDSSTSSSTDSDAGRGRKSHKRYTSRNGGTTIVSKQFNNYGGTITNIKNVETVNLNIQSGMGSSRAKKAKKKPDPKPAEPANPGPCKEVFRNFHSQETMRETVTPVMTSPITNPNGFISQGFMNYDDANTTKKILCMMHSVCKVCFGGRISTGFRVGIDKVMLTNHAYEEMRGTDHPNFARRPQYMSMVDGLGRDNVYALFKHDSSNEVPIKFSFKEEIHFIDRETDTAVLSLMPRDDQPMPEPFKYFSLPNREFVFIGHPDGHETKYEPVKDIVNINDATKREISLMRQWCRDLGPECHYDNPPMVDSIHRLLFHSKMKNGCSGSPGLALVDGKHVVVVTMYLHKYPDMLYDPDVPQEKKDKVPNSFHISQGANMFSVYDSMKKQNPDLCKEIFHSWQD